MVIVAKKIKIQHKLVKKGLFKIKFSKSALFRSRSVPTNKVCGKEKLPER
jgi:hypothetical protein